MTRSAQKPPLYRSPRPLPRGTRGLVAMDVASDLAKAVRGLRFPRGYAHLRDQLWRAADHAVLRLEEGCCRTAGNRYQHLQGAYAEAREAQRVLLLMTHLGLSVPADKLPLADRLGGLLFGLLRRYQQR